jgi:hypothetical protein
MKKLFLLISSSIILFSCGSEKTTTKSKEEIVKTFIDYCNKKEINNIDSLTSSDFESLFDTTTTKKSKFLDQIATNINTSNQKTKIIESKTIKDIVKTKEIISNDVTDLLEIEPFSRVREYHFNENNKIKFVHTLEWNPSPNYNAIQNKFMLWARDNHSALFNNLQEKFKEGKNVDEERKVLLLKIREVGIQVLEEPETSKQIVEEKETSSKYISATDFRKSVVGKTKKQIKKKYGKPCYSQTISHMLIWYYGSTHCGASRTIIYDDDTEKEVSMAQIQFSGDIATGVNYF